MHFTYTKIEDKTLKQGDVIGKNSDLDSLLERLPVCYANQKNCTHLMVITQTCDLVPRHAGKSGASCISLCCVTPVEVLLEERLRRYRHESDFMRHGNVCGIEDREDFIEFLGRLWNNNEHEFFFLAADPELGFGPDSCAFLRLAFALPVEDYDTLLSAKKLELNQVFRAKLGWMVGTIYSRIGTQDWVPDVYTLQDEFDAHLEAVADKQCKWLESARIAKLRKQWKKQGEDPSVAASLVEAQIVAQKPLSRKQRLVQQVLDCLELNGIVAVGDRRKVENLLFPLDEVQRLH